MNIVAMVILSYLLAGVIFLGMFDLATRRIRDRLEIATMDTQNKMAEAGTPMSTRTARIMFVVLMWVFWPAVLLGVITGKDEKEDDQDHG